MMNGEGNKNLYVALRAQLVRQRTMLLESLAATPDAADTVELDQTRQGRLSRMDAMQQQAMAQANRSSKRTRLAAIEAALSRIDAGDYGECRECGEMIAAARLKARPEARLCIVCKTRSEQQ